MKDKDFEQLDSLMEQLRAYLGGHKADNDRWRIAAAEAWERKQEDLDQYASQKLEEYRKGLSTSQGWVSVKERLPEPFFHVLIYGTQGHYGISCIDASGGFDDYTLYEDEEVTHWMPLPPRPESEQI